MASHENAIEWHKAGGRCAKKNQAWAIVTALLGQAGPFLCIEYAVNPMGFIKGRIHRPPLVGKNGFQMRQNKNAILARGQKDK